VGKVTKKGRQIFLAPPFQISKYATDLNRCHQKQQLHLMNQKLVSLEKNTYTNKFEAVRLPMHSKIRVWSTAFSIAAPQRFELARKKLTTTKSELP
jgi:hypothetical protein